MKRPPMLMRVQIRGEERKSPLWLPLFSLLPLASLLVIILPPLTLIAIAILRLRGQGSDLSSVVRASLDILCSVRGIRAAFDVLCSMPGLRIDVCNRNQCTCFSIT